MKTSILFPALLLLIASGATAQFQSDLRLTNDPAVSVTYANNAGCIAASGDTLHIVWNDDRDGNYEIYYKRSTDGGASWEGDTRLTNDEAGSLFPCISASGNIVMVVWEDQRDLNYEIYYKRSTDGGASWGTDIRLTANSDFSNQPSVSIVGQLVHIVWQDSRDLNYEIYDKRSTDGGLSWEDETRLTNNISSSENPCVSVSDGFVYVVWNDMRDTTFKIFFKRSPDGGVNWEEDSQLSFENTPWSGRQSVSASGSLIHVVWQDLKITGIAEIYNKRSTDNGVSWEENTQLTNNTASSVNPSVTVSDSNVHVVWQESQDGNEEIYYKRSTDGGVTWEADTRLTMDAAQSWYPSLAVSGTKIHTVWTDDRDGNHEIYYKADPTGNPVGMHEPTADLSVIIAPNPATDYFTVSINAPLANQNTEISIFNQLGENIYSQKPIIEKNIDCHSFPAGIYLVSINDGEKQFGKKLMIAPR